MTLPHSKGFLRVLALLALLLFSGDLIADALADISGGHCVTESSQPGSGHDKAPCAHCSCATHSGAIIVADFAMSLCGHLRPGVFLTGDDRSSASAGLTPENGRAFRAAIFPQAFPFVIPGLRTHAVRLGQFSSFFHSCFITSPKLFRSC
jgi:hypothetical protein